MWGLTRVTWRKLVIHCGRVVAGNHQAKGWVAAKHLLRLPLSDGLQRRVSPPPSLGCQVSSATLKWLRTFDMEARLLSQLVQLKRRARAAVVGNNLFSGQPLVQGRGRGAGGFSGAVCKGSQVGKGTGNHNGCLIRVSSVDVARTRDAKHAQSTRAEALVKLTQASPALRPCYLLCI